jgi:AAA+ ATPase superfamily predicted ATPase
LDRLEKDYTIIAKYKPIHARPQSRAQKYRIIDNFLNFWFRYIYRNRSAIETGNFVYVKDLVKQDYSNYCGKILEKFFRDLLAQTNQYNRIGSYWEKGNENEIDLVAVNDMKKEITIAEVKMNKAKIDLESLKRKSKNLLMEFPRYKEEYSSLSLADVKKFLEG